LSTLISEIVSISWRFSSSKDLLLGLTVYPERA
jgi:hypothetical protein